MKDFKKRSLYKQQINEDDKGVYLEELLDLIKDSEYYDEMHDLLDVDKINDKFINIPGASALVEILKQVKKKYYKIDLESDLKNVDIYDEDDFSINFNLVSNNEYLKNLGFEEIVTTPIYSAKNDFFSDMFHMDKYANDLIKSGHDLLLKENLRLIKEIHETRKKYRLLHDVKDNSFYLRAITSTDRYYNYDNNIAVVIGLLSLYKDQKHSGISYKLNSCDHNESYINMFFESSEFKKLGDIGIVKNLISISNDEIKKEALRFIAVCSIHTMNDEEVYLQSKDVKFKILGITHGQSPKTAIPKLANIENTKDIHEELYKDISKIATIKNPEEIKFLVLEKVSNAKNPSIKVCKNNILKELSARVATITELLELFNKINLIVADDISAKEYLRFIQYNALVNKK